MWALIVTMANLRAARIVHAVIREIETDRFPE